jgi:hypothetical protein
VPGRANALDCKKRGQNAGIREWQPGPGAAFWQAKKIFQNFFKKP